MAGEVCAWGNTLGGYKVQCGHSHETPLTEGTWPVLSSGKPGSYHQDTLDDSC